MISILKKLKSFVTPGQANNTVRGFVDKMNDHNLYGWVQDNRHPNKQLEIQVIHNNKVINTSLSNLYRKDLEKAKIGNGNHAFQILLPNYLFKLDNFEIVVKEKETGIELQNSPYKHSNIKKTLEIDINNISINKSISKHLKNKDWDNLIEIYDLYSNDSDSEIYELDNHQIFQVTNAFIAKRKYSKAQELIEKLINIDPLNPEYYTKLAYVLNKQNKVWQELDTLLEYKKLVPEIKSAILMSIGNAKFKIGDFKGAIDIYKICIERNYNNSELYFNMGEAYINTNSKKKAKEIFNKGIKIKKDNELFRFGPGLYFYRKKKYLKAIALFIDQIEISPLDENLHFYLANSYDRTYNWSLAIKSYINALSINKEIADWHYRLGFAYERNKQFSESSIAYYKAIQLRDKKSNYWLYRLGCALYKSENYEKSCITFSEMYDYDFSIQNQIGIDLENDSLSNSETTINSSFQNLLDNEEYDSKLSPLILLDKSLKQNSTELTLHKSKAEYLMNLGDWENALDSINNLNLRLKDHEPKWYYYAGLCFFKLYKYKEAANAFKKCRILGRPFGVNTDHYTKTTGAITVVHYTELIETLPLKQNTILYESFLATQIGGSPFSIFENLIHDNEYKNFLHVWAINDKTKIPQEYKSYQNVIFIEKANSYGYMKHLATAKYLINNSTFPYYFIRRKQQRYLNTWHGTPLKTLGKDIKTAFYEHKNTMRNFLHATHIISPNEHTTDVILNRNDVAGLYSGKIAETGYPRIDKTLNISNVEKLKIKEKLDVSENEKLVLYAPTFRGTLEERGADIERLINDIKFLLSDEYTVLFRGHYFVEENLNFDHQKLRIVPSEIHSNELLGVVDLLISDYSSIMIDYLVTDKPLIVYAYDVEQYKTSRGLYFSPRDMAGEATYTIEDCKNKIKEIIDDYNAFLPDEKYLRNKRRFCSNEDGNATIKAINFFLRDDNKYVTEDKNRHKLNLLLFEGPFMPNGICTSFINLAKNLNYDKYNVAIVIDPNNVSSHHDRIEKLREVTENTQALIIPRVGRMNTTAEEKYLMNVFEKSNTFYNNEIKNIYKSVYEREFLRIFGYTNFESSINFEGYSVFWSSILGAGPSSKSTKKNIYQHNDMHSEWKVRFPYLKRIFLTYQFYDSIISVSGPTMELNKNNLSHPFGLNQDSFKYCINSIVPSYIRKQALDKAVLDDNPWFQVGSHVNFITIGRLSPEKDHQKMFKAIAEIKDDFPDIRLTVLGEGPLRNKLQLLVKELGLQNIVSMPGNVPNPFPFLAASDCFLLSSNHEGQPMVLLESMTLKKPIISTNITGSKSALEGGNFGYLVNNNVEGLENGLRMFLEGMLEFDKFNAEKYVEKAMTMFYQTNDLLN